MGKSTGGMRQQLGQVASFDSYGTQHMHQARESGKAAGIGDGAQNSSLRRRIKEAPSLDDRSEAWDAPGEKPRASSGGGRTSMVWFREFISLPRSRRLCDWAA